MPALEQTVAVGSTLALGALALTLKHGAPGPPQHRRTGGRSHARGPMLRPGDANVRWFLTRSTAGPLDPLNPQDSLYMYLVCCTDTFACVYHAGETYEEAFEAGRAAHAAVVNAAPFAFADSHDTRNRAEVARQEAMTPFFLNAVMATTVTRVLVGESVRDDPVYPNLCTGRASERGAAILLELKGRAHDPRPRYVLVTERVRTLNWPDDARRIERFMAPVSSDSGVPRVWASTCEIEGGEPVDDRGHMILFNEAGDDVELLLDGVWVRWDRLRAGRASGQTWLQAYAHEFGPEAIETDEILNTVVQSTPSTFIYNLSTHIP